MRSQYFALCLVLVASACAPSVTDDADALRQIHAQILQAHRDRDPLSWTNLEDDTVTVGSRGEVFRAGRQERLAMREQYLGSTRFSVYRDLQEPIVQISADGTQGWLLAQVEVVAHPVAGAAADSSHTVWAWIELYEKRAGRWLLVGNVSNERPGAAVPPSARIALPESHRKGGQTKKESP